MNYTVRKMDHTDIPLIVDYFVNADADYLLGMGAEKHKFPKREDWIAKLELEFKKPVEEKQFYYIIWLEDGQPIGHCNIDKIIFGKTATMHLHLWKPLSRKRGVGTQLSRLSIPYFFKNLKLEVLVCEPYALNPAPAKTLPKLGFEFKSAYTTTPGCINFEQLVNRFEMTFDQYKTLYS